MAETGINEPALTEGPHSQLGLCLKAARQARGLTLKQVAEKTGMALSTLSKVENGLMSLTYDKLLQLTSGLKMDIAELFSPTAPARPDAAPPVTARRSISRAGQGKVVNTKFYTYTYQCTDLIGKRMVPMITEVRARTLEEFGPLLRHAGEEYFLVTRGTIAVHTEFYAPEILRRATASISTAPWATPTSMPARAERARRLSLPAANRLTCSSSCTGSRAATPPREAIFLNQTNLWRDTCRIARDFRIGSAAHDGRTPRIELHSTR